MFKLLGALFLLVGVALSYLGYMNSGPAWGESLNVNAMMRQGGIYFIVGGLISLVIGGLFIRKRPM